MTGIYAASVRFGGIGRVSYRLSLKGCKVSGRAFVQFARMNFPQPFIQTIINFHIHAVRASFNYIFKLFT